MFTRIGKEQKVESNQNQNMTDEIDKERNTSKLEYGKSMIGIDYSLSKYLREGMKKN